MDKLIEDLNLSTLMQNGENLSKVALSPEHSINAPLHVVDIDCVENGLNPDLAKGRDNLSVP